MTEQMQLLPGLIATSKSPEVKNNPDLENEKERAQVWSMMSDGQWWTLYQLQKRIKETFGKWYSDSSISARVRDFRKTQYGAFIVERRQAIQGTMRRIYEYRIVRPQ